MELRNMKNSKLPNLNEWQKRILRDELLTKSRNPILGFLEYIQNCECTGNAIHIFEETSVNNLKVEKTVDNPPFQI